MSIDTDHLRRFAEDKPGWDILPNALREAADEIDALRAQLATAEHAGMEKAAEIVERMLVYADTTSSADKAIAAAIRSKAGVE